MAGKHTAVAESWQEIIDRLRERRGQWQLVTNFGTYATINYLRSIGCRTQSELYAVSPTGEGLETVWAMMPEED